LTRENLGFAPAVSAVEVAIVGVVVAVWVDEVGID
jgi:hypothetical protein